MNIERIKDFVEHRFSAPAKHAESVKVVETFGGKTVWQGMVEVFDIEEPAVGRAYAWPVEGKIVVVEHVHPVTNAVAAVRAWIASEAKK